MRIIIGAVLNLVVLLGGAWMFPDRIYIADGKTACIAVVYMTLAGLVCGTAIALTTLVFSLKNEALTIIFLLLSTLIVGILKIYIADYMLPGFAVSGIMTYIVLDVIMGIANMGLEKKGE